MNPENAVHTAAAISYRLSPRPEGLPRDFDDLPGVSLAFYELRALDGHAIPAALWHPRDQSVDETTLIVMVHGSGGSFRRLPQSRLGGALASRGYASLAIDTRQAGDKVNTDNFFDTVRDVEAAVHTARALGYRSVVLQGHSLGNIQVQLFAATNWDADIKGVILIGAFGNLPWKTQTILIQDESRFRAMADAALECKKAGDLATPLPVAMRTFSGQDSPLTAQHFLTYRWDKTSAADGTYWIKRVPYPVLLVRDAADAVILDFESHMLFNAAKAEGSLVESVELVTLVNAREATVGAHYFEDTGAALADAIESWCKAKSQFALR